MNNYDKEKLLRHLLTFVSRRKQELFVQVLSNRTRYIAVALEDIYQPQNASAVVRSCECLGIQDIHIIENKNTYRLNKDVTLGASKWVTLHRYNAKKSNTEDCIAALKKEGYRIIATSPGKHALTLEDLPVDKKIALFFGTEEHGLSAAAMNAADECIAVPMYGFTESFNLSVSVALCLCHLSQKLRKSDVAWQLNAQERLDIHLEWARQSVKKSKLIEERFLHNIT